MHSSHQSMYALPLPLLDLQLAMQTHHNNKKKKCNANMHCKRLEGIRIKYCNLKYLRYSLKKKEIEVLQKRVL